MVCVQEGAKSRVLKKVLMKGLAEVVQGLVIIGRQGYLDPVYALCLLE
jgi:hypothetical protein